MVSSGPLFFKKFIYIGILGVSLALSLVSSAHALEKFATYPPLPSDYSSIKVFDREGRLVGRLSGRGQVLGLH